MATTQPTGNVPNNAQALVPIQQDSPVMGMPFDIFVEIFRRVSPADVVVCPLVCKHWNQLFQDNVLCRNLLENHFPFYTIPKEVLDFQKAYKDQSLLNCNRINGVYAVHGLQGHTGVVFSFAISGGKLISGSFDNTIKIWDLNTNTCLATLQEHTDYVASLAISGDKLISGSFDNTIKIWDLNTNTCLATLPGHTDYVTSLAISGDKLFSGSFDNTIKIWDLNTNTCLATLPGHTDCVIPLAISGDKLFSGSNDNTIKIWDLNTNTCLATLQGHIGMLRSLAISGDKLISGSSNRTIKIWDLSTNTCLATLPGHTGTVNALAIFRDKLFSASSDRTIKIWDLSTNTCLATLQGHTGEVYSLAISGDKLISGSRDNTIRIWNFDAKHTVVFEELAKLLESGDADLIQQAMDRFSRMPKAAKHQIYGELYQILKPLNLIQNDYWGCAEHAFHNIHGQSSTPLQRAQAIQNYVKKQRQRDVDF